MLASRRLYHGVPLCAHRGRGHVAARADKEQLVTIPKPVTGPDSVFDPHRNGDVSKPQAFITSNACGNNGDVAHRNKTQSSAAIDGYVARGDHLRCAGRIVIVGSAIHAGLARPWLEPPFRVSQDDAVFFLRQRDNFRAEIALARLALDFFATVLALTFSPAFARSIRALARPLADRSAHRLHLPCQATSQSRPHAVEFPARDIARNGRSRLPGLDCGVIDEG